MGAGITPMPDDEARRLSSLADFERYCDTEDDAAIAKRERKYASENAARLRRFEEKVGNIRQFNEIVRGAASADGGR